MSTACDEKISAARYFRKPLLSGLTLIALPTCSIVPADILSSLVSVRNCIRPLFQSCVDQDGKRKLGPGGSLWDDRGYGANPSALRRVLVRVPIPVMFVVHRVVLRRIEHDLQNGSSMNFGQQLHAAPHGLARGDA